MLLLVPGGMAVVAEDQFGADARDLAGRLRRLRVAEVAEELHGAFQAFGGHRIVRAARFQFQHIENLRARGNQPAERVGQSKGHALALPMIELAAAGVGGLLQVIERPQPHLHGRGQGAGAGSGAVGGDAPHLGGPGAELGEEDLARSW